MVAIAKSWRSPLLLAGLFCLLYAWFYAAAPSGIFHSPDENAVAVFARQFAEAGNLRLPRVEGTEAAPPRSVTVRGHSYVPASFIGLPVMLGYMRRWFGEPGLIMFVPVLAALAPLALFVVWRAVWGHTIGWTSAVLLFTWPAWAYYASRSFLPNSAFVSLLAISAGLVLASVSARTAWLRYAGAATAGLAWGGALAIRPVEVLWVLPMTILLFWWWRPAWKHSLYFGSLAWVPLAVLGYWQAETYGFWYLTGYGAPQGALTAGTATYITKSALGAFFPFGIHPWTALQRFVQYQFVVYWWALPFLILGLGELKASMRNNPEQKKYAVLFLPLFCYLILYYGSWDISDHPDRDWISLGVAYNRYWLPFSVLAMPILVLGARSLATRFRWLAGRTWIGYAWLAVMGLSAAFVFGSDNLWSLQANGVKYAYTLEQLQAAWPAQTVIVADREDKWLWPYFAVIRQPVPFFPQLPEISGFVYKSTPVLWLTSLPQSHVQDLSQRVFSLQGISVQLLQSFQGYNLYQFHEVDK